MSPAWHILGAGAIGGMMACRWQHAGVDVRIIPRDSRYQSHRQLIFQQGDNQLTCDVPVDGLEPIHRLLLTTKAQHGVTAVRAIAHRLAPDGIIVVMQNGLGMHEQILDLLSGALAGISLVAASTTEGANRPSPDQIVHAGTGTTALGPWRNRDSAAARVTMQAFMAAGLTVVEDPCIRQRLWEKLVMNCAINPLTALLDCRNGDLLHLPGIPEVMDRVVREVVAVMQAEGLTADAAAQCQKTRQVAQATAANVSSMCTDYRAGRETEIDSINGELVRRAEARGIPAPANTLLLRAVCNRTPWQDASLRLFSPG
jgi:2-dehydropantoate 2-reductase